MEDTPWLERRSSGEDQAFVAIQKPICPMCAYEEFDLEILSVTIPLSGADSAAVNSRDLGVADPGHVLFV